MKKQTDNNSAWNKERKKTNRNALFALILAAIIGLTFFIGYFVRGLTEPVLSEIWKIINETSVYTGDMTEDEIADLFVKTTLKEDKYAKYYSAEEYAKILEEDKGRYSGVGIGLIGNADGTAVYVAKVYLNSPAYKKGVKTGDRLVAGKFKGDTEYTDFAEKANAMNADKDEKDKITVLSVVNDFFSGFNSGDEMQLKFKRGSIEPEEKTLKKEDYTVSYVEYKDNEKYYYFSTEDGDFKGREDDYSQFSDEKIATLSEDTGYIKLYEFEGGAAEQFKEALDFMVNTRGKSKLILDLRDNGGGLMDVLLEIASYVINNNGSSNIRILYVKEKSAITHYSTSKNKFVSLTDISVIANTNTASASECLIGALSDYGNRKAYNGANFSIDKRLILTEQHGERGTYCTYGKGIMQTTYPLKSGGALKLTTAEIFWPISWNSIQNIGITSSNLDNCVSDGNAISRANEVLR